MIHDILAPALEKRTWEVVAICEEKSEDTHNHLLETIKKIKNQAPLELINDLNVIEDLFIQKNTETILLAYQMGIEDYKKLISTLKGLL
ncbi:hypothetical protein D3C74_374720 [compost metagenome]